MSEVSLDAESETTTTDLHMDYEEDHETEDSLRSDRGDENEEGDYESVDLDKDQSHPTGPWPEGGCEEPEPQLDADVQGVHGHPDVASSGDHVIMKGGAGDARGAHHHTNTSQTPEANGQSCSSQTQVMSSSPLGLWWASSSSLSLASSPCLSLLLWFMCFWWLGLLLLLVSSALRWLSPSYIKPGPH